MSEARPLMNLIENAVRLAIQQAYVRLMAMPRLVRGQTPSKVVNQVKEVQSDQDKHIEKAV